MLKMVHASRGAVLANASIKHLPCQNQAVVRDDNVLSISLDRSPASWMLICMHFIDEQGVFSSGRHLTLAHLRLARYESAQLMPGRLHVCC